MNTLFESPHGEEKIETCRPNSAAQFFSVKMEAIKCQCSSLVIVPICLLKKDVLLHCWSPCRNECLFYWEKNKNRTTSVQCKIWHTACRRCSRFRQSFLAHAGPTPRQLWQQVKGLKILIAIFKVAKTNCQYVSSPGKHPCANAQEWSWHQQTLVPELHWQFTKKYFNAEASYVKRPNSQT